MGHLEGGKENQGLEDLGANIKLKTGKSIDSLDVVFGREENKVWSGAEVSLVFVDETKERVWRLDEIDPL